MKTIQFITIALFALMISLPFILDTVGISFNETSAENRRLETRPSLTWDWTSKANSAKAITLGVYRDLIGYKDKYKRYYADNFIIKPQLFESYYNIKTGLFNSDPLPQKVVKGKDGWFFLGDSYSNAIAESKGVSLFSAKELDKVQEELLKKKAWLEEQGIDFYVAVAPNKHSIYGEHLPIEQGKTSKLEQFKAASAKNNLNVIDLAALFDQAEGKRLFLKTNTHWNELGAFWGYKAIIKTLQKNYPQLSSIELDSCTFSNKVREQEDLTGMLNIKIPEDNIIINYPNEHGVEVASSLSIPPNYFQKSNLYEFRYKNAQQPLKLLLFRDSFSTALKKFLKESFGEFVCVWAAFNKEVIEQEKPDIVIYELVERDIDNFSNY